ncbi:hypothetical protein A7985_09145 [Pseudoalteromonas luteoviolacea]|uniref:Uncharacterized protein n=1 Tax=Pseudoalteromonas luteoviolacea TaxID=43657 RepID=A0A1C0TRT0_9GAMM|nr:hypothetical protein [Pseudoalteromonas luteoviolacea]OCQ21965.1 hypothetical protein A7985_09145 [Pseudoalteromonas luteoviolacea]
MKFKLYAAIVAVFPAICHSNSPTEPTLNALNEYYSSASRIDQRVAKALVYFQGGLDECSLEVPQVDGSTLLDVCPLANAYGVDNVIRLGEGQYQINLSTELENNQYIAQVTGTNTLREDGLFNADLRPGSRTRRSLIVECKTADTSVPVDCDGNVEVYGQLSAHEYQSELNRKLQAAHDLLSSILNSVSVIEGPPGRDGVDGLNAQAISVKDNGDGTITLENVEQGSITINLPKGLDGLNGRDGTDGTNGVSLSHSWSGTTLSITSASGTSSADLKGEAASLPPGGKPGQVLSIGQQGQYTWVDQPKTMGATAIVRFKGGISDCPVNTDCPIIGEYNVARVHHYKNYFYRIYFKTPMSNDNYAFNSRGGAWWGSNQSGSELVEEKNHTTRTKQYIEIVGTDYVNAYEYAYRGQVFIYDLKNE